MEIIAIVALTIFLATILGISIRRFKWFNVKRPIVAMMGGALMLLCGVVSPMQAFQSIDLGILALLLGMMIIVAALELCGFFTWVSMKLIAASKNQFQFLVLIMVSTAILSALILNDAVVLLFTPIIIRACRLIKANPIPFLIAEAVSANIGSVATEVGNPQNVYIAAISNVSFVDFSIRLVPVSAISLMAAIAIIWMVFRKELREDGNSIAKVEDAKHRTLSMPKFRSKPMDAAVALKLAETTQMHRSIYLVLGILLIVFIGFIASPFIGIPIAYVAFMGGASVLVLLPISKKETKVRSILKGVDWTLLLFFVGLFVVLKGVDVSGLMSGMVDLFQDGVGGNLGTVWGLSAFSAILSNLISNVPAVMLLAPFVSSIGSSTVWLTLAASSTLAGNATILGAAANVIVAETGERMEVNISFWRFIKVGLPVTVVTLIISIIILQLFA
jgi:Na+/H+ antiporter NhaD/arsenite permease-like protein